MNTFIYYEEKKRQLHKERERNFYKRKLVIEIEFTCLF